MKSYVCRYSMNEYDVDIDIHRYRYRYRLDIQLFWIIDIHIKRIERKIYKHKHESLGPSILKTSKFYLQLPDTFGVGRAWDNLAKLSYFTHLEFVEIRGSPFPKAAFWGSRSCFWSRFFRRKIPVSDPRLRPKHPRSTLCESSQRHFWLHRFSCCHRCRPCKSHFFKGCRDWLKNHWNSFQEALEVSQKLGTLETHLEKQS